MKCFVVIEHHCDESHVVATAETAEQARIYAEWWRQEEPGVGQIEIEECQSGFSLPYAVRRASGRAKGYSVGDRVWYAAGPIKETEPVCALPGIVAEAKTGQSILVMVEVLVISTAVHRVHFPEDATPAQLAPRKAEATIDSKGFGGKK